MPQDWLRAAIARRKAGRHAVRFQARRGASSTGSVACASGASTPSCLAAREEDVERVLELHARAVTRLGQMLRR
jgi:hypothetical protein